MLGRPVAELTELVFTPAPKPAIRDSRAGESPPDGKRLRSVEDAYGRKPRFCTSISDAAE
jgi:hypothetical protein